MIASKGSVILGNDGKVKAQTFYSLYDCVKDFFKKIIYLILGFLKKSLTVIIIEKLF